MRPRFLLAVLGAAAALGIFTVCGGGNDPAQEIPDEAVQSDEAAPLAPGGEDTLSPPD
jgi:hypothetical protein